MKWISEKRESVSWIAGRMLIQEARARRHNTSANLNKRESGRRLQSVRDGEPNIPTQAKSGLEWATEQNGSCLFTARAFFYVSLYCVFNSMHIGFAR